MSNLMALVTVAVKAIRGAPNGTKDLVSAILPYSGLKSLHLEKKTKKTQLHTEFKNQLTAYNFETQCASSTAIATSWSLRGGDSIISL